MKLCTYLRLLAKDIFLVERMNTTGAWLSVSLFSRGDFLVDRLPSTSSGFFAA